MTIRRMPIAGYLPGQQPNKRQDDVNNALAKRLEAVLAGGLTDKQKSEIYNIINQYINNEIINDPGGGIGSGLKGDKGDTGDTGPAGADGNDGAPGEDGADGASIVWRGVYAESTEYALLNTVESAGSSYICILAYTGGATLPADDTTHWALMAQKGATGANGVAAAVCGIMSSSYSNNVLANESTLSPVNDFTDGLDGGVTVDESTGIFTIVTTGYYRWSMQGLLVFGDYLTRVGFALTNPTIPPTIVYAGFAISNTFEGEGVYINLYRDNIIPVLLTEGTSLCVLASGNYDDSNPYLITYYLRSALELIGIPPS